MDPGFWAGKRVFITGHTGFKGSWLAACLHHAKANVTGFALPPPTDPSLFKAAGLEQVMVSVIEDIRDHGRLSRALKDAEPEIVFHLAAQSLVRRSYVDPVETYGTNVMGTVNLLDAVRHASTVKVVINVTSDKCYQNNEWMWPYRENDRLGGFDPYSNSKGCSEMVTEAFRKSFFDPGGAKGLVVAVASARAGNVIGGGDWASDRLLPDVVRALARGGSVFLRNPRAIRPWQHVLEPLSGYLLLAERMWTDPESYSEAWNFGPDSEESLTVAQVVQKMIVHWGGNVHWTEDRDAHPHEARHLTLDSSKARARLGWRPRWDLDYALQKTVEIYRIFEDTEGVRKAMQAQIHDYFGLPGASA